VSGAGALLVFQLQGVGKGISQIHVQEISAKNSQMQPVTVAIPPAAVTVQ
jgi:hypothetical protein